MTTTRITNASPQSWEVTALAVPRRGRRATAGLDPFLERLEPKRLEVAAAFEARPVATAGTRRKALESLRIGVEAAPNARFVLAVRHASGAISFHAPQVSPRRAKRASATVTFELAAPARVAPARRGVDTALRGFVLRAIGALLDPTIAKLVARWETAAWRKRGLTEGWVRVTATATGGFALEPVVMKAAELGVGSSLLLLHGTFSDTRGSFAQLAAAGFFKRARARYAQRIFAFEHHTIAKGLDQNARELLAGLPPGRHRFDVIGYSRGTLLARALIERRAPSDSEASLEVESAVFVAGPHRGTPLASPARYRETLGWFANLIELFPDVVFTTALSWIAEGLVWMAHRVLGALPGLAAMDPDGKTIAALRKRVRGSDPRYAAVVADFSPDTGMRARLLDVAADGFFADANDLVVPLTGAVRLGSDGDHAGVIPAERVLRFARARRSARPGGVHHVNVLGQPETARFLLERLLPRVDATTRGARKNAKAAPSEEVESSRPQRPVRVPRPAHFVPAAVADATFHILVLAGADAASESRPTQVVASYGGARVVERYAWRDRDQAGAGRRWREIVVLHKLLLRYFQGEVEATPLDEHQLDRFGRALFEALFVGQVGRLYDEARAHNAGKRLNVVLSSNVARWAEKPWEFAFDPVRKTFLATQEIHLLRDVLGAIPSDRLAAHAPPLRVLVAYAQPIDASALSVEDERRMIERGFKPLIEARLAHVEVLARATPATLHRALDEPGGAWDILHFIGHGVFDEQQQRGKLLFEDEHRRAHYLNERQLCEIVARRGLRLVFLNACETARGGIAEFARGVAPALLRDGVPAVIANQFSVFDSAAVTFAQALYARLARGATIAEATREARIALNYGLAGTTLDWAVPALFTRVPELRLVERVATRRAAASVPHAKPGPRRVLSVGVWDVSHRFPDLEDLLGRLNRAQPMIAFELAELALPLDARVVGRGGKTILDAEVTRRRLQQQPSRLGLDLLIGLTHLPLRRGAIPQASSRGKKPRRSDDEPVLLFSYAGSDVVAHGKATERLIAGALAELVAAHLAGIGRSKEATGAMEAILAAV